MIDRSPDVNASRHDLNIFLALSSGIDSSTETGYNGLLRPANRLSVRDALTTLILVGGGPIEYETRDPNWRAGRVWIDGPLDDPAVVGIRYQTQTGRLRRIATSAAQFYRPDSGITEQVTVDGDGPRWERRFGNAIPGTDKDRHRALEVINYALSGFLDLADDPSVAEEPATESHETTEGQSAQIIPFRRPPPTT